MAPKAKPKGWKARPKAAQQPTKAAPAQALRIEYVPLDAVVRFDRNPKKHDVGALVQSVRRYGFRDAPIFDGTLKALVAGHGRLKALEAMRAEGDAAPVGVTVDGGEWLVPIQMGVDAKSAAEAKAFLIDHNALTLSGGDFGPDGLLRLYERDGLGEMLREAEEAGELPVTFDADDLDELLNGPKKVTEDDPSDLIDHAEELRKKWGVESGQLWILGDHRLLCGDSTKAEDVALVMGGEKAGLVYTDPPYGVGYDGGTTKREKLAGDEGTALYAPACVAAFRHSDAKAPLYLWHAGVKGIAAAAAAAAAGYEIRCELVWNKNLAQFGALSAQYKQKHEPCYYCVKRGTPPRWFGPTNEVTVWDVDRAAANEFHPTQKPVELAARAMRNSSESGDVVADWFMGSGATLIAAEQLGRKCYGIEIAQQYVAVTLQRWADATGQEPRRA